MLITVLCLHYRIQLKRVSGECCHDHNQACPECKGIVGVLKAIEHTLRNGDLDLTEKQKVTARCDLNHSVSSIDAWKLFIEDFFNKIKRDKIHSIG